MSYQTIQVRLREPICFVQCDRPDADNTINARLIAECHEVLANGTARLRLSALLFGLFPAGGLPFLIRSIGQQCAHYLTLMTRPVAGQEAQAWGLVSQWVEGSGHGCGPGCRRGRHVNNS